MINNYVLCRDEDEELDLTGIDEDEIDSYIMTGAEIRLKTKRWLQVNSKSSKNSSKDDLHIFFITHERNCILCYIFPSVKNFPAKGSM